MLNIVLPFASSFSSEYIYRYACKSSSCFSFYFSCSTWFLCQSTSRTTTQNRNITHCNRKSALKWQKSRIFELFVFQIQGLRNAIPKISYKRNQNGITLFWKTKSSGVDDAIGYYQVNRQRWSFLFFLNHKI